jgi:hypothetical protein
MANGLHVGLTYGAAEALDKIGNKALRENGSELVFNQSSEPHLTHTNQSGEETVVELLKHRLKSKIVDCGRFSIF